MGYKQVHYSIEPENEERMVAFKAFAESSGVSISKGKSIEFEKTDGTGLSVDEVYVYNLTGK